MPFVYDTLREEYNRLCAKKELYKMILSNEATLPEDRERIKKYRKSVQIDMKIIEKILSKKDQRKAKRESRLVNIKLYNNV